MGRTSVDPWQQYESVQAFKDDPRSTIDGINYARVIALYLYDRSPRHWVKMIVFSLLFSTTTEVSGDRHCPLSFYSYRYKKRQDYDYIAAYMVEKLGEHGDSAESKETLSGTQWYHTLLGLPKAYRATAGYRAGRIHRLGAAALIAKYRSTADRTYGELVRGRSRLVTFCDAAPHDNLMAQLAKANGIRTYTAQHGQYRLLDQTNMSIDAEAYANFVSDRLFCWGDATCNEFERFGIKRDRMIITGWIRTWDHVRAPEGQTGVFGVMLNGGNGVDSNVELLQAAEYIAGELGLRYIVRLHPSFTPPSYNSMVSERCEKVQVMSMSEYVCSVDFSIAHMSGATIEMLQVGSPVYALDDGRLAQAFRVPGLSFRGADAILEAVRLDGEIGHQAVRRTQQLRRWFNDDADQDERVITSIIAGGV